MVKSFFVSNAIEVIDAYTHMVKFPACSTRIVRNKIQDPSRPTRLWGINGKMQVCVRNDSLDLEMAAR